MTDLARFGVAVVGVAVAVIVVGLRAAVTC
jgi:hypothetical protein